MHLELLQELDSLKCHKFTKIQQQQLKESPEKLLRVLREKKVAR